MILGINSLGNPDSRSRPPSGTALEFERRSAVEFTNGGNERWLFAAEARDEVVVAMMGNADHNRALQDPFLRSCVAVTTGR